MRGKLFDINDKVINAIKKYPILYKNNATVEQRKVNWQKLASEMGLPAQFLMTRWHFLRERYQKLLQANNFDDFKYKSQMEFMRPYMRVTTAPIVHENQAVVTEKIFTPEFVITEEDILDDLNNSENEEYTFLEMDATRNDDHEEHGEITEVLEANETVTLLLGAEGEDENELHIDVGEAADETKLNIVHLKCEQQQEPVDDAANEAQKTTNNSNASDNNESTTTVAKQNLNFNKETKDEKKNVDSNDVTANANEKHTTKLEQKESSKSSDACKDKDEQHGNAEHTVAKKRKFSDSHLKTQEDAMQVHSPNTSCNNSGAKEQVERCEDVIFVELVAAIFKTMPPERKRAVKKEIMNILL